MKILLFNPDNGTTRSFMPHLWMFLLQELTPPAHQVLLMDGNTQPMTEEQLARFVSDQRIELVGIGAMTRMAAKAYRMADAVRGVGVPVVMGGPHVTAVPDEALGRNGGPRHADAVAVGEADETWPGIVEDAARGRLRDVYRAVDGAGKARKPTLQPYPSIRWDTPELDQFNLVPRMLRPLLRRLGGGWRSFRIVPVESGRGCPYGCEFCTVTGFFGDKVRFRTNQSVIEELLRIKARAREESGQAAVFFVDDNFAIDKKRAKSLLRDIIAADAKLPWIGQISPNLLRDEELIDLIAESGGRWLFLGLESVDASSLADVNKGFNKPGEYAAVLERLARRGIYAITSLIFGMDHDEAGVADRTLEEIDRWPPVLPVFGQLTPYPDTPLYKRLEVSGRLARPKHWMEFAAFEMAHKPARMTMAQVRKEIHRAWSSSYSRQANAAVMERLRHKSLEQRAIHMIARMLFRGLYFPQVSSRAWMGALFQNRRALLGLIREGIKAWSASRKADQSSPAEAPPPAGMLVPVPLRKRSEREESPETPAAAVRSYQKQPQEELGEGTNTGPMNGSG